MRKYIAGMPKSGTHALRKACELLGVPSISGHARVGDKLPDNVDGGALLIVRDPRNLPISWARYMKRDLTEGTYIAALRYFDAVDQDLIGAYRDFGRWSETAPVFRYESLIDDDKEMRRLAGVLNVPYLDGAWESLPGNTATWYPTHVDYRTIWTPRIEAVWQDLGGPALLEDWGYGTADSGR